MLTALLYSIVFPEILEIYVFVQKKVFYTNKFTYKFSHVIRLTHGLEINKLDWYEKEVKCVFKKILL